MRVGAKLIGLSVMVLLGIGCGDEPARDHENTERISDGSDGLGDKADAGETDAGDVDPGAPDARDPDAGDPDAGDPDAGDPDAGDPDASDPDAGDPDAGDPDGGDPDPSEPSNSLFASGVEVRHVAVFQAVKVPLVKDRAVLATHNAPVVSGREALVRVYFSGSAGGARAELEVFSGSERLSLTPSTPAAAAVDEPGLMAVDFQVPAAFVHPQSRYRVRMLDDDAGQAVDEGVSHPARFPADGSDAPMLARPDPGSLKILLVPVPYINGGVTKLPDTSPEQLARMREMLQAIYPTTDVQLEVRDAVTWSVTFKPTKNVDFGALNNKLAALRKSDGVPFDTYLYGLVSPGASRSAYCGAVRLVGCVTGQGWVVTKTEDAHLRVASGMGFSGDESIGTLIHELGHLHGRSHAPCKASGDKDYPYSGGLIGSWGFDATNGQFHDPGVTSDFMGYCDKTWVSDYTWNALYERTSSINARALRFAVAEVPMLAIDVDADGHASVEEVLELPVDVGEPGVTVTFSAVDGAPVTTASSRAVQSSNGGTTLFVPRPEADVATVEFTLDGVEHRVFLRRD